METEVITRYETFICGHSYHENKNKHLKCANPKKFEPLRGDHYLSFKPSILSKGGIFNPSKSFIDVLNLQIKGIIGGSPYEDILHVSHGKYYICLKNIHNFGIDSIECSFHRYYNAFLKETFYYISYPIELCVDYSFALLSYQDQSRSFVSCSDGKRYYILLHAYGIFEEINTQPTVQQLNIFHLKSININNWIRAKIKW